MVFQIRLREEPCKARRLERGGIYRTESPVFRVKVLEYRQAESFTCGYVAALTIIDGLYPVPLTAQEKRACKLRELINMDRPDGVSERHFIQALRLFKVKVYQPRMMNFETIVKWIDKNSLVATLTGPPYSNDFFDYEDLNYNHWCVIYGYSRNPDCVYLAGMAHKNLITRKIKADEKWEWNRFAGMWPEPFGLVCRGK